MWDIKTLETQHKHSAAATCQPLIKMRERARTGFSDEKQGGVYFALAQILWLSEFQAAPPA
jgi:hypothetical protein